jgi:hypothetical protein
MQWHSPAAIKDFSPWPNKDPCPRVFRQVNFGLFELNILFILLTNFSNLSLKVYPPEATATSSTIAHHPFKSEQMAWRRSQLTTTKNPFWPSVLMVAEAAEWPQDRFRNEPDQFLFILDQILVLGFLIKGKDINLKSLIQDSAY